MGRPVMLGNGSLTVGLNEQGLVHDFYYPYVGLDNLTTSRSTHHLVGVWADGRFSWVDDGSWKTSVDFETDALISHVTMEQTDLHLKLEFQDFVDSEYNAFCRQITVHNLGDQARTIRLFMHQVFEISRAGRADTALFVPDEDYILDYKGRCSLLIYGQTVADKTRYDQFSVGNYGIEGKQGTFMDAEDGELSGNAVEHGGVDSVIRFSLDINAGQTSVVDYYIIAGDAQTTVEKIHDKFRANGLANRLDVTRRYWHDWLSTGDDRLKQIPDKYLPLTKKSLLLIKAHIDKRGGIIASCDSSIYNYGRDYYSYVWPRDGAYAIWPLIRLGFRDEPRRFFEFCRDILTPDGYLMHKYQPDRAIGSTWHPLLHGNHKELAIQEDETAIVIYMLGKYYAYSKDQDFAYSLYNTLIQPATNFLASFRDQATGLPHASYDLWEERFASHSYTAAVTHGALLAAADFADVFEYPDDAVRWRAAADEIVKHFYMYYDEEHQRLRKSFLLQPDGQMVFDDTLDVSSLYATFTFGNIAAWETFINTTAEAIENELLNKSPTGGSPRYMNDKYFAVDPPYAGNPWFVTTLWLAQYYLAVDEVAKAEQLISWTMERALPSGAMSEQVNPTTGQPLSVTPLVWSHAEFVNTVLDLTSR